MSITVTISDSSELTLGSPSTTDHLVGPARWFLNQCQGDLTLASQMLEFASKLTYYRRRKALDQQEAAPSAGRCVWRPGDEAVATSTMEGRTYGDLFEVIEVCDLSDGTVLLTLVDKNRDEQRACASRFAKVKRTKVVTKRKTANKAEAKAGAN